MEPTRLVVLTDEAEERDALVGSLSAAGHDVRAVDSLDEIAPEHDAKF